MSKAFIAGVGMTKFEKPGSRDWDYPDMVAESLGNALADAGISYPSAEVAYVGYVAGESASGQRALYQFGMTEIPIYNQNNNCASGSTALQLAVQSVRAGVYDIALAVGFEKMQKGSIGATYTDRAIPVDKHLSAMAKLHPPAEVPLAAWIFGGAGQEHTERYGTTPEQFALAAVKNHQHSVNNPYAQFQDAYTLEEILASPRIHSTLTRLQCSPTSDGSAAAVVMSERAVREHGLEGQAVQVLAQAMTTDGPELFTSGSAFDLVGAGMCRRAAERVYNESGLGPEDVDVVELHDCFSINELISYEVLGFCEPGKSGALISEGATTYGGKWVVNPSGGLISKGHPIGATGLAQCAELSWQLRGEAGARQVEGARVGLQHNAGLGGAAVVTMYGAPRS